MHNCWRCSNCCRLPPTMRSDLWSLAVFMNSYGLERNDKLEYSGLFLLIFLDRQKYNSWRLIYYKLTGIIQANRYFPFSGSEYPQSKINKFKISTTTPSILILTPPLILEQYYLAYECPIFVPAIIKFIIIYYCFRNCRHTLLENRLWIWVLALVSAILAPETNGIIIPSLRNQPRLKAPAQRLWWQAFAVGHL